MHGESSRPLWVWRRFAIRVPGDWEMLQFSRGAAQGRCAFADRHRYRLEFGWRVVAGPPDFDRMLRDYAVRLTANGCADLAPAEIVGWQGLRGTIEGVPQLRMGRYFDAERCLVECVFLWPGAGDLQSEGDVLSSVKEDPGAGDFDRWRAFGMDVAVPKAAEIELAMVAAASAELTFRYRHGRLRARRLGLLEGWFDGDVASWLRRSVPSGFRVCEEQRQQLGTHTVHRLRAARQWGRRVFRPHDGDVLMDAWLCERDGRLYCIERRQAFGEPLARRATAFGAVLICAECASSSGANR